MICRITLLLALCNLGLLFWILSRMQRQRRRTAVLTSVRKVLDVRRDGEK